MRALALAILLGPGVALACWNEVRLAADDEVKGVALAEAALQSGDPVKALKTLRTLYGKQAIFRPDRISTDPALGRKAWGLVAIATVRARKYDPKTGRRTKPNRQRQVQRLARIALKNLVRLAPDDPLHQARYAEALARDAAQAVEARGIFERLAKADLIAEAEGWLTLAQLRAGAGDVEASTQALHRCLPLGDAMRCALPKTQAIPTGPG